MTDTPGPCGCRIEGTDDRKHPIRIDYCPTHAAAFETARRFKLWQDEDYPAQVNDLREMLREAEAKNADLLAALYEIRRVARDDDFKIHNIARAAIAKAQAKEEVSVDE